MCPHRPSDDVDRDAVHPSHSIDPEDDGEDYELEPPDESVLTTEQRLAAERIAAAARSIDVDELQREEERRFDLNVVDELTSLRFQFQIKHLLWATAAVALLVSVAHYNGWASVLLGFLIVVGSVLTYLSWKEREHEAAIAERRRQQLAKAKEPTSGAPPADSGAAPSNVLPPATPRLSFTQQLFELCTPKELLIAAVSAAVILTLLGSLLGAAVMAMCLGILALLGVVAQALGADMPRLVALGWWLLLVLYVVISVILAASGVT